MLPKTKRLSAKDFKGLKPCLLYRGSLFDISGVPSKTTKYACVISKKRIRRAVDRNKVKRRIYTTLQTITPSSPYYIIVYPTKHIFITSLEAMKSEFQKVFATL